VPPHRVVPIFLALLDTLVARRTERVSAGARQRRMGLGDDAYLDGSGDQRMGQYRISTNANVRLRSKMSLGALFVRSTSETRPPYSSLGKLGV